MEETFVIDELIHSSQGVSMLLFYIPNRPDATALFSEIEVLVEETNLHWNRIAGLIYSDDEGQR